MSRFPTLFVSHGAPTLALGDSPAHRFLAGLGRRLGRPEAIVVASAHWEARPVHLGGAARPEVVHDFYGFPAPLYALRYPAPGAPALAERAAALLAGAGLDAVVDPGQGLDHGAWVPLLLMYPQADVPVLQVSIDPGADPRHHHRLGEALRPLRDEGVLVLGSGGVTHNLRAFRASEPDAPPPGWVREFSEWVAATLAGGADGDLLDWRERAPNAARNHPSPEHFVPLLVTHGAAHPGEPASRLHASFEYGALAMDAYAFGEVAPA